MADGSEDEEDEEDEAETAAELKRERKSLCVSYIKVSKTAKMSRKPFAIILNFFIQLFHINFKVLVFFNLSLVLLKVDVSERIFPSSLPAAPLK